MYNDAIKVANKIITGDDLSAIFQKMAEDLENYKKIYDQEEKRNRILDSSYQTWTLKHFTGRLKFRVNFYDDTEIQFDNYNNFITIFNNRIHEIKNIYVTYSLSYEIKNPGMIGESFFQSIYMNIYENKANIDVSISSYDKKMDEVYNLIKEKILNAPDKYDRIIKNKSSIKNKIILGLGFIPGIIISVLLLLIPEIRNIFSSSYVLFPLCCVFLSYLIGVIFTSNVDSLYETIVPRKEYAGYDSSKGKSIYKDDLDSYLSTGEILIGKNVNNLKKRNEIVKIEQHYSKIIPIELIIIFVLSVVVIFL